MDAPKKLGHLYVTDQPPWGSKKIEYVPSGSVAQIVSDEMLVNAQDQFAIIHYIAETFARMFAKDIETQLLAALKPLGASNVEDYHKALYEKMADPAFFPPFDPAVFKELLDKVDSSPSKFAPPVKADESQIMNALNKAIPGLKNAQAPSGCPACGSQFAYKHVTAIVVHLNDDHGWSREKIADWLETLDCDLSFAEPEGEQWKVYETPEKKSGLTAFAAAYFAPDDKPFNLLKNINPA